ncbi:FUSC family protein [Bradyrhizobium sp.]|uniref:FUSC family protein n=1 Tax=Bradyrhizobium sp. TaxID=376 RepID=UPI001D621ECC|nr:FUSC family protein [Bradyrhizobium sp.]MBV8697235.1 FUSC family protein [Bradyrhizobium sp.]MBV8919519.1 FUSC family protein [Bradyrhizobium sp.]MBV9980855.1 FUSC family protein [Bradyrhizobium sp.]
MKSVNAHERSLAGLGRSLRAAIAVPSLFALALIVFRQPELAGFAVFGTFAHQVLVNYDPAGRARFVQSAMLTALGAIMLSLATLASANPWLAVSGAVAVGFLSELPPLTGGRIAAIRSALLLVFMLAVAVPAPATSVFPYLAGWLIAGFVAQPALLLIWIPIRSSRAAADEASSADAALKPAAAAGRSNWRERALRAGLAFGFAVLLTRLLKVEHAFWVVLGVLPVLSGAGGSAVRTFWQEQAGTLAGFLTSAIVVAIIGPHPAWYWSILPFVVFGSTYAASTLGLMAGQAAFTLFAVVLFSILLPQQGQTGLLRLEDIAIGGAVSLTVGALLRLGERKSAGHGPRQSVFVL